MSIFRGSTAVFSKLAIVATVCMSASTARAEEPFIGSDAAFEHLVDRGRLVSAIRSLDAEALADIAIQFCEAERSLLRPPGAIPTDDLLQLAIRAGVERRHEDSLNRLERYARQSERQQLADQIAVARKLAGAARTTVPEPLLPIEDVTPELVSLYQEYKDHFSEAKLLGDSLLLSGLEASLQNEDNGLPEVLRTHLLASIADCRTTMPNKDNVSASLYSLLSAASRGSLNQSIVQFCRSRIGRRVGDGECATLVTEAFQAIGARRYPPHGPDADYVWGKSVYGLQVSGGLNIEDGVAGSGGAQPGDIIQFRNATFKGQQVNADGSRRSWSSRYPHHTAVIASVNGGRWTVYHQNVGPSGKSEDAKRIVQIGRINLRELDSGWLKVYRPVSALSGASRSADAVSADLPIPQEGPELVDIQ